MKLCLISPPVPFALEPAMNPPLGLCYLSSYVKSKIYNIEVVGIDYALDYDENYLEKIPLDCDWYGISAFSAQFKWVKEIITYLNTTIGEKKVIVGGSHASVNPEEVYDSGAAIVVKGEGELSLYKILLNPLISRFNKIINSVPFDNLDILPMPDRELFGLSNYKRTISGEHAVHLQTVRGCPYACRFCHKSTNDKVRFRSIENVLQEMDYIIDNYGIRGFIFYDDIFTLKKERVFTFCKEFEKRNILWRCWSRTDLITEDLLAAMKDSGLTSITFGVESGDDRVLSIMNKRATAKQNYDALMMCNKVGVPVRCSLIYGSPGENRESVDNTINLIKETQPAEWNLAVLAPVPGSIFWDTPEKYGLSFSKEWVKENDYLVTNRFHESGVGSIWINIDSVSKEELHNNLQYMLEMLEDTCPRRNIQDTIQIINKEKIDYGNTSIHSR